ncbi:MAG: alpha-glucosidase [Chloroflexi bacterium]|nr:alpha-glucosidase [Chloroflexota bacterium]
MKQARQIGCGCLTVTVIVLLVAIGYVVAVRVTDDYRIRPVEGQLVQSASQRTQNTAPLKYVEGSFEIEWDPVAAIIRVTHLPDREAIVWESVPGVPFVAAGAGMAEFHESRAHYRVTDHRTLLCGDQSVDRISQADTGTHVEGTLACDDGTIARYHLVLYERSRNALEFSLSVDREDLNRLYLTSATALDEHVLGFGTQYTLLDMKGQYVPIFVSEQGIGRGIQPLTLGADLQAGAGGTWSDSYAPVPYFLTDQKRGFLLWNDEYSAFDMRADDRLQVTVYSNEVRGTLLYGETPSELVGVYTELIGRMAPLPDWITAGAIIGLQGGTERVRDIYSRLREHEVPVTALWLQDWVGRRETSFGSQLWWNWQLDTMHYPAWDSLSEELANDGVRLLIYVNPYLADISEKPGGGRNLYQEAVSKGYVVRRQDASPYLLRNTDFSAAMIDFTNPEASAWYRDVLSEQVRATGAAGWMADFGEGLPVDAVLFDGASGDTAHNHYPVLWAQFNQELAAGLGEEIVYFMRSGYRESPTHTSLFWLGDQMVAWDAYDGIKSAVTGLLSSGLAGFAFNHSDIGGYTTITNPIANYYRTRELLGRWSELNAFTPVFRTHEGNRPDQNAQIYDDDQSIEQFARAARIHEAWGFYRSALVSEAAASGLPVVRPMMLVFPHDPAAYDFVFEQFMVGDELLVAPVLDPDVDEAVVYLPEGSWVQVWTGIEYEGPQSITIPAPMGYPAVFFRSGSEVGLRFVVNLRAAGLID